MSRSLTLSQRLGLSSAMALAISLSACASQDVYEDTAPALTSIETSGSFLWTAEEGVAPTRWYRSGYTLRTPAHEVMWSPGQVVGTETDTVSITIEQDDTAETNAPVTYRSGEMVTLPHNGFGRYEVVMRPAKGTGLVSTFFLYTGASEKTAHNEINMNFPGKDTRSVALSYVSDGTRGPDKTHTLAFDAADAMNLYAIEYSADAIRWFVGDEMVFETPADALAPPQAPMPIVANLWAANPSQYAWTGAPDFESGASAEYACISFVAAGETGPSCSAPKAE